MYRYSKVMFLPKSKTLLHVFNCSSNLQLAFCGVGGILTIGIASNAYVEVPKKSGKSPQLENLSNSEGCWTWPYKYWYIDTRTMTIIILANHDNHVRESKSLIRQKRMRKGRMIGMYTFVLMCTTSNSAIPCEEKINQNGFANTITWLQLGSRPIRFPEKEFRINEYSIHNDFPVACYLLLSRKNRARISKSVSNL